MSHVKKSILYVQDDSISIDFFALSFRNYILSKKDSDEIKKLQKEYSAPGTWDSMKIPMLSHCWRSCRFPDRDPGRFYTKVNRDHYLDRCVASPCI